MNLVLSETVYKLGESRRSITILPPSFEVTIKIETGGLLYMTFKNKENDDIHTSILNFGQEIGSILESMGGDFIEEMEESMLATINYDILYFITHGSYEANDMDGEPNSAIVNDIIPALNMDYMKSEWLDDLIFECVIRVNQPDGKEKPFASPVKKQSNKKHHKPNKK